MAVPHFAAGSRMIATADTHVHLLAGLDDGPQTLAEAVAMAEMLVREGVRHATALAHQNPDFPANDAALLRQAAADLDRELHAQAIPLAVYPSGEVMLTPETADELRAGRLLTVGGHGKHLLVEMPHGMFLDIVALAEDLRVDGVRLVIAHAERYPELLHDAQTTDRHVAAGCLIQVTAAELARPNSAADERALKDWATRGLIHLLGSDGHNLTRRQPRMAAGVARLAQWAGPPAAERVAGIWGAAVLQGSPVNPPPPRAITRNWFGRLLGG